MTIKTQYEEINGRDFIKVFVEDNGIVIDSREIEINVRKVIELITDYFTIKYGIK